MNDQFEHSSTSSSHFLPTPTTLKALQREAAALGLPGHLARQRHRPPLRIPHLAAAGSPCPPARPARRRGLPPPRVPELPSRSAGLPAAGPRNARAEPIAGRARHLARRMCGRGRRGGADARRRPHSDRSPGRVVRLGSCSSMRRTPGSICLTGRRSPRRAFSLNAARIPTPSTCGAATAGSPR